MVRVWLEYGKGRVRVKVRVAKPVYSIALYLEPISPFKLTMTSLVFRILDSYCFLCAEFGKPHIVHEILFH